MATLNLEEWKELRQFIKGQIDTRSEVFILFQYLYRYRKSLDQPSLAVETANQKLFNNKSRKNFLNIMSRLVRITEDFFLWTNIEKRGKLRSALIINEMNNRGLYDQANKVHNQTLTGIPGHQEDILDPMFQLLATHYQYYSENPIKSQNGQKLRTQLTTISDKLHLDLSVFYFLEEYNSAQLKIAQEEWAAIAKKMVHLEKKKPWKNPILEHLYELRVNDHEASFRFVHQQLISGNNWSDTYCVIALIYCNLYIRKKITGNDRSVVEEMFELIQFGLKEGYLLYRGRLSQIRFFNIVDYAVNLEKLEWAERFINEWSHALYDQTRNNDVALARCMLHFARKQFEECLALTAQISSTNLQHRMRYRWISLKTYYELYRDDRGFMIDQLHNFLDFFKRNQQRISFRNVQGSIAMAELLKSLLDGADRLQLAKELQKTDPVVSRMWLEQKIKNSRAPK